jgi:hypothetical protein
MKTKIGVRVALLAGILSLCGPGSASADDGGDCASMWIDLTSACGYPAGMMAYLPPNLDAPTFEVLYVHGGAWVAGGWQSYAEQACKMAGKGAITFSVEYGLHGDPAAAAANGTNPAIVSPNTTLADETAQVACAVGFADYIAYAQYGVVTNGVVTMQGGSAGAHLTMASTLGAPYYDKGLFVGKPVVALGVSLSGPAMLTDFGLPDVKAALANSSLPGATAWMSPQDIDAYSPYRMLDYWSPSKYGNARIVMFNSPSDTIVPYHTAEVFCGKMGGACSLFPWAGGHGLTPDAYDWGDFFESLAGLGYFPDAPTCTPYKC